LHGNTTRLDTYIDIPLEIALPDFVSDDNMEDGSPLVGSFKLVLQSVVCHRGSTTHSGHYVSLVRGTALNAVAPPVSSDDDEDPWMLFDDIARERVRYVDIKQALKEECPYLLFYQVQPILDESAMDGLPSYHEATSRANSNPSVSYEKIQLPDYSDNEPVLVNSRSPPLSDAVDWAPSTRTSMDAGTALDASQARRSMSDDNRNSIVFDDSSIGGSVRTDQDASVPTTPTDESRSSFLQLPSRRGSRQLSSRKVGNKSRPGSNAADNPNRFSLSMSRITSRMSRNDLPPAIADDARVPSTETTTSESEASFEHMPEAPKQTDDAAEPNVTSNAHTVDEKVKPSKKDGKPEKEKKKDKGKQHEHHHHRSALRKGKQKGDDDRECIVM